MKKRVLTVAVALILSLLFASFAFAADFSAWSDPNALSAEGTVTLYLCIKNTGSSTIDNISISNANGVSFDTSGVSIAAGTDHTFSKRVTVPAGLIGQSIGFTITYNEGGESKSGSASVTILAGTASSTAPVTDPTTGATIPSAPTTATTQITATRSVSTSQASPGDVVAISYVLTNGGITDVTGVSITDKEIGGKNPIATNIVVPAGQSYTFDYQYTMGKTTVVSAPVISYLALDGTQVNVSVAEKTLGMVNTKLDFSVEQGASTADGVTFTLFLTNNGNQKLSKLKVVDEQDNTVDSDFSLAIGESKSITYSVPTDKARNVVFYVTGVDATGETYADNSKTFSVREYVDPSLIGVDFTAEVIQTLNSGSITVKFTIVNSGSLTMTGLVLSESEIGDLYNKESLPNGTETIEQNVYIVEPRDLVFTLSMNDPAGNPLTYTAYVSADYVGIEASDLTDQPTNMEIQQDAIIEKVNSVGDILKTALIVIAILTVIACIALIVLSRFEREEKRRIAKRRAQREKMQRDQQQHSARLMGSSNSGTPNGTIQSHATPAAPIRQTRPADSNTNIRQPRPADGGTNIRQPRSSDDGTSIRQPRPIDGGTNIRQPRPTSQDGTVRRTPKNPTE